MSENKYKSTNQQILPKDLHIKFNDIIRDIKLSRSVTLIDLDSALNNLSFDPTIDGLHFNQKGSFLVAKKITNEIKNLLK